VTRLWRVPPLLGAALPPARSSTRNAFPAAETVRHLSLDRGSPRVISCPKERKRLWRGSLAAQKSQNLGHRPGREGRVWATESAHPIFVRPDGRSRGEADRLNRKECKLVGGVRKSARGVGGGDFGPRLRPRVYKFPKPPSLRQILYYYRANCQIRAISRGDRNIIRPITSRRRPAEESICVRRGRRRRTGRDGRRPGGRAGLRILVPGVDVRFCREKQNCAKGTHISWKAGFAPWCIGNQSECHGTNCSPSSPQSSISERFASFAGVKRAALFSVHDRRKTK